MKELVLSFIVFGIGFYTGYAICLVNVDYAKKREEIRRSCNGEGYEPRRHVCFSIIDQINDTSDTTGGRQ